MRNWTLPALALAASALPLLPASAQTTGTTQRVSLGMGGVQADGTSYFGDISGNGRWVVFESNAGNLVAGNRQRRSDIYLRDRMLGTTILISVHKPKGRSIAASTNARMARGSRYVAFQSLAYDLVDGDTNQRQDVFVRDRMANRTVLASRGHDGGPADGGSQLEALSPTGRFVAFTSTASNLTTTTTPGEEELYVRDLKSGTTTLESVNNQGEASDRYVSNAAINLDGRFLAFVTQAHNLSTRDKNNEFDIYLRDRATRQTILVTTGLGGTSSDRSSNDPVLSDDGQFVAFDSFAANLAPGNENHQTNAYIWSRSTRTIRQIGLAPGGVQPNGGTSVDAITPDGRYVLVSSGASNLVPNDTNKASDLFVCDTTNGGVTRVDLTAGGQQVDAGSYFPYAHGAAISADNKTVAFESSVPNLVPGDTNGHWDVFVRPR